MSSYSRNKYRCLLKPNVNVFHLDNNIQNQQNPKPRIYPYGYPSVYPGGYPGFYPGFYPGGYSGGYPYPYVEKKDIEKKDKPTPKMNSNCYYDSSSSSSSDDYCRYRDRRYRVSKSAETSKKVKQSEKPEQPGQQRNNICEPDPCEFDPFKDEPNYECDPAPQRPAPQRIFDEVKHEKKFAKPLAKLFTKFTTSEILEGEQGQPQPQNEMNQPQNETHESPLEQKIDGKKIYLK